MASRATAVYFAKLAGWSERYEEMCDFMEVVCSFPQEFSGEERQMFIEAFSNATDRRRAAFDVAESAVKKNTAQGDDKSAEFAREYRSSIEAELEQIYATFHRLSDNLLSVTSTLESKVVYHRKKAEYYRKLAEIKTGPEKKELEEQSVKAAEEMFFTYDNALAFSFLHLVRLDLLWENDSQLYRKENMRELLRKKFVEAIANIPELPKMVIICEHVAGAQGTSGSSHVCCTDMAGDAVGTYEVPRDNDVFGPWLWQKVSKAATRSDARLFLMKVTGETFWCEQDLYKDPHTALELAITEVDSTDVDALALTTGSLLSFAYVYRDLWKSSRS